MRDRSVRRKGNGIAVSRKAQQSPFMALVLVVSAVVVILVVLAIFWQLHTKSKEEAINNRCKASVYAYAKYSSIQAPFSEEGGQEAEIDCPTRYITVETDTPREMRRDVADLMAECWDNFGRGKLRLFTAQDEKFCVICSVFRFEDRDTSLDGLPSFLMFEQSQYRQGTRRLTYHEFIQGVRTQTDVVDETLRNRVDEGALLGSEKYAVMFTYYKQSYWSQLERGILGGSIALVGSAIGVVIIAGTGGLGTPIGILVIGASVTAGVAIGVGTADDSAGIATEGADWDANVILAEYNAQNLVGLGCEELPVSQLPPEFR
ncbi:hypothetical protein KY362_03320 [Candidatus Woesearchaeota archaeon]|nr:hypothetical protein [Candidatus Woesearchaeota archaeon]